MSKKISDIVELIEENLVEEIEQVEISEEEAMHIKENILKKIEDFTEENPIEIKKYRKSSKKALKRFWMIAAILGLLVTTAIGAIGISETIGRFFKEQMSLLLPNTQEINEAVSKNGVTMTVDTAIASDNGGIVILHFTKDDGSTFEDESEIKKFNIGLKAMGSSSWSHGWELSKDRKVLTYLVDLRCNASIIGSSLKVMAEDIAIVTPKEKMVPIELSKIVGENLRGEEKDVFAKDRKGPAGISLEHPHSDAKLSEVMFIGNTLEVEIEYTYIDNSINMAFELIDTRTGEVIEESEWGERSHTITDLKTVRIAYGVVAREDLPYLAYKVSYNDYDIKQEGLWEKEFTFQNNDFTKHIKKVVEVPVEGGTLIIDTLEISLLGGRIEGKIQQNYQIKEKNIYDFHRDFNIELILKDGSRIPMYNQLSSQYPGNDGIIDFYMNISVKRDEDKEAVEEVESKRGNIGHIIEQKFIDIDQVVGIQIEDTTIKLN